MLEEGVLKQKNTVTEAENMQVRGRGGALKQ